MWSVVSKISKDINGVVMDVKERKSDSNRIERVILRDLLSILTLKMSVESNKKLSRTEALSLIMKNYYKSDEITVSKIQEVDEQRKLKPRRQ